MLKEFLNTKLATILLSGALILVMIITARILVQKRVIDREIAKLKNQMESVQKNNEQLSSLIQYLNTEEFTEREAREKLNLSKEGEFVVVLPAGDAVSAATDQTDQAGESNFKLWVNYFFNHVN